MAVVKIVELIGNSPSAREITLRLKSFCNVPDFFTIRKLVSVHVESWSCKKSKCALL